MLRLLRRRQRGRGRVGGDYILCSLWLARMPERGLVMWSRGEVRRGDVDVTDIYDL